jgi:trans-aconitate methyltransferase
MSYFDDRKNVDDYVRLAEGYDGRELIDVLAEHLPTGSTVLELGMGPGVDLELLAERYAATGSDSSAAFVDRYREQHPKADLLQLDAAALETDRRFDAIYSNKVLIHLEESDLRLSFRRQRELLNDGGLALHSFWLGDGVDEHEGLVTVYYTEEQILDIIGDAFHVVATARYAEMDEGDSFYLLLGVAE